MEKNVGGNDRNMRWAVGTMLVTGGLFARGWKRLAALGLGATVLGSAAMQKCACNKAMGINTYKGDEETTSTAENVGANTNATPDAATLSRESTVGNAAG